MLAPLARLRPATLAFYAASYGSLTAIFEALTGGIPLALTMLPLLLALGFEGSRQDYFSKLVRLWVCFGVAVVACFAFKKGLTVIFLSDQDSFFQFLFYRMYGQLPDASGVKLTIGYILSAYRRWSALIALGSSNIGMGLILASLGVFVAETWRTRKSFRTFDHPILIACWLGVAVLIAWCLAFPNHTAVHPYYMARVLVVLVIGAALLVAARLLGSRSRIASG